MKIDFVMMWVDGNDPKWQQEKAQYSPLKNNDKSNSIVRYRDWDNLQYWFRSIEKYASWVNKIYFITWGHCPKWLNKNHPKLVIVNHKDFIFKEYLPTFNSTVIELNLHRIKGLSEHFILFNDDLFLINKTTPNDFFKKYLPREVAVINPIVPQGNDEVLDHHKLNDVDIINKYFTKQDIYKHIFKVFNYSYGINVFRSIFSLPFPKIPGFKTTHGTTSLLKSTIEEIWLKEETRLDKACLNKFRTKYDYNQYLFKYWQIASNKYYPQKFKFNYYYEIKNNNDSLKNVFKNSNIKTLCLNDSNEDIDFELAKDNINKILEEKFPTKSSFEK